MKKCVPVLLFSVLSASVASHADINARQKMFSNRLKIQLQIDELRAELAGTRDAQKREDLRKKLESLERQKKSLR